MNMASSQRAVHRKTGAWVLTIASVIALLVWPTWTARAQDTPGPSAVAPANYLTPVEAKFSPDGTKLNDVWEDDDSVLALDVRNQRVVRKVKVGHKPNGVAISPDGKILFVSNEWSDTVSVIDAASFQVRRTLATGWGPVGQAPDQAGKTLYVANSI